MNHPVFRHEAMATWFEITIAGRPESYARQAAAAAFRELDRLETELSRYVESSDIARANRLAKGESTVIGEAALECLLLAAGIAEATAHAFDPAYASVRGPDDADGPAFTLDPEAHALTSRVQRLHLDLGAVGKGYALDHLAAVLDEWGIGSACLNSGGSSVLLLGTPGDDSGWSVRLGEEPAQQKLSLTNCSLSGSGVAVKGSHLIDPRSQQPAVRLQRAWALAPEAAVADALSTAFFVMSDAAIAEFCAGHAGIGAAWNRADGGLQLCGTLVGVTPPRQNI